MGFLSRGRRSEPEVALNNLCASCAWKNSCMDGLKYSHNDSYGIVQCPQYEDG